LNVSPIRSRSWWTSRAPEPPSRSRSSGDPGPRPPSAPKGQVRLPSDRARARR
jgi:hypothetical protein